MKSQLNEKKGFETVGMGQLTGILSFLGVACLTGFILLMIEFLVKKMEKILQKRKKVEATKIYIPGITSIERFKAEIVTKRTMIPTVKRTKPRILKTEGSKMSRKKGHQVMGAHHLWEDGKFWKLDIKKRPVSF